MDKTPKRKGCIIELKVMAELLKYGEVSIPYGNNARYDCILDINGALKKVQIKTARRIDENRFCVPFANTSGCNRKPYSSNEVDYIATYYNKVLYLFPIELGAQNQFTLSFEYPSNGLRKCIHIASDFLAEKILL